MTSRLRGAPFAAVVATAGLIGAGAVLTATEAKAPIDADTLKGYHAKDFGRAVFTHNPNDIDGFDSCSFTTVLSRKIIAPTDGYILASGDVSAARDDDSVNSGLLRARLTSADGLKSSEGGTALADNGIRSGDVSVQGMAKVSMGPTTVNLQIQECGEGAAFVSDRSISVLFVPFGSFSEVMDDPTPGDRQAGVR